MLLCGLGQAHAQSDTTRPAIGLSDASGATTFSVLPSPLRGTVFDAGGMGQLWVSLSRNHSGANQWWNGSAWSSSAANFKANIGPADASHTSAWSVSATWPTGANLPRGTYTIGATAYDAAGNRADIARLVNIGAPDAVPPAVTIVSPVNEALVDTSVGALSAITGTANDGDGAGVAYVVVRLSRNWGEITEYWNGTTWTSWADLPTNLGARAADGTRSWNVTSRLPSAEQMPSGRYYLNALAYDFYGNRSIAYHMLNVTPRDTTAPVISIAFPAEGQQISALPSIYGRASDAGSGVKRVIVDLRRLVTGADGTPRTEYWNGQSWGASYSNQCELPSVAETGWTRSQNLPANADLPPGEYLLVARSVDGYYNVSSHLYRRFRVVNAPPLRVDASVRASLQDVWLGESIVNSDAVGQTLSRDIAAGQVQSGQIKIALSGVQSSQTVRLSVAGGSAFGVGGWKARFYDAPAGATGGGTDVTSQITSASGWPVVISDGQTRTLRVEVTAPAAAAPDTLRELTVRATANPTSETPAVDTVKMTWRVTGDSTKVPPVTGGTEQTVAGTEYSLDGGVTWTTTPAGGITVPQWSSVGFRALKGNSTLDWPDSPFKPQWKQGPAIHWGEQVYLYFPEATPEGSSGETAEVECGNTVTVRVRVQAAQ